MHLCLLPVNLHKHKVTPRVKFAARLQDDLGAFANHPLHVVHLRVFEVACDASEQQLNVGNLVLACWWYHARVNLSGSDEDTGALFKSYLSQAVGVAGVFKFESAKRVVFLKLADCGRTVIV